MPYIFDFLRLFNFNLYYLGTLAQSSERLLLVHSRQRAKFVQ